MSTARNPQPLIVSKTKGSMVTAQFPDGTEITRNQALFRSMPNAPPESMVQRQPEPEAVPEPRQEVTGDRTTPCEFQNEQIVERSIAKDRARRDITKPKRFLE
jgi:hypothetical protein